MSIKKQDYYLLVQQAQEIYSNSGNISAFLRNTLGLETNTPEIIEISYDLQAGSYVDSFVKNRSQKYRYCAEIVNYLNEYVDAQSSLLEVGCGEATTTFGVFDQLAQKPSQVIGFDISFSRIKVAIDFWNREYTKLENQSINQSIANFFVADLFHIPLANRSVDVVYTSHSIEPNGGKEIAALQSIFRIARKRVLLFEPYFEAGSPEIQQRMNSHGYVKNIPEAIKASGGILRKVEKIDSISNPLNPTYLFDVEVSSKSISNDCFWADPVTKKPLNHNEDCFYCPISGLAYPIIRGIPCLRPENGILATQLMNF